MSGGLGNPQGWNRYSYVENDPVNYGDPMGLQRQGPWKILEIWTVEGWKTFMFPNWDYDPSEVGGGSGGGGGPSLSEQALSRVRGARKKLLGSKSLLDPDCQDLLNSIWEQDDEIAFSMTAFTDAISNAQILAAELSADLYADLWQYSSLEAYATQQIKYGALTISGALQDRDLQFAAASQYHGAKVYFNTPQLQDATFSDIATTLIHESFHLIGFTHTDLQNAGITDSMIRQKCVKE